MTIAVLLTCHGTVDRVEDLPAFIANIRRGRPAPAEVVAEVRRRYERIGGSPLMRITAAQADALAERLGLPVRFAGRLWGPYPREVLAELYAAGARTVISLPLAPQSVEIYHAVVREAAAAYPDLELRLVPPWGEEPALIDAFVEGIEETLAKGREAGDARDASDARPASHARDASDAHDASTAMSASERAMIPIVLTAHSLPQRVIDAGDAYEREFRAMARAVEERMQARGHATFVAFQSQGMTGDAWIGPDLATTFAQLAASGATRALLAPIGFCADHVETLYDLDIEAQELAKKAGLSRVLRASAMNTRPRFIDALAAIVKRALPESS